MVQMNLTVPQAPERSSPVILRAAKDLVTARDRPFAALRVTRCDCSNGQEPVVQIEPCLKFIIGPPTVILSIQVHSLKLLYSLT